MKKRGSMKWPLLALLLLSLVGFGPVISVWIATTLAKAFGCAVDPAGVHACQNHAAGSVLGAMFGAGAFEQTTAPVAAIAVVGWIVLLMAALFRMAKR